ncbi:PilZ domain-containing protein [Parerythrobacter aestuarii]|uniref:PilZ domain-containing protein n=1 Tax=Parerythrobacter aestuarii TaxID=3020909 RepID=UPI0024DE27FE|nr:PilZ domain-containing protein [Parerythrobacter aestuarii]
MPAVDTRNISRDSLFLMADLRLEGADSLERVKVRNLSAGGMMAEGSVRVMRGARLSVKLRNIEWVDGSVAWVQDNRFGIAFDHEVDPAQARSQPTSPDESTTPRFVRTAGFQPGYGEPDKLRKI